MPKISVIIPVYNTASWLEECLNSVVNQTLSDLEIICVDDASTDKSGSILKQYAHKDKRIQIITLKENLGLSHARNIGLDQARGEYIYFLDSDDYIVSDALEILYNVSKKNDTDIVYFDANPVYETAELKLKNIYISRRKGDYESITVGIDLFLSFIKFNEWVVEIPRQFYLTSFIRQNHFRFREGVLREDVWFSNECIFTAKKVKYIPNLLFNRRFRENSIMTGKKDTRHFLGEYIAVYYTNRFAHQNGLYEAMRSYIAKLNNRTIALFDICKTEIRPEELNDPELINSFYLFESLQDCHYAYGELSEDMLKQVCQYENVYIYGAGVVAKSVYAGLVKNQIPIQGFIVSNENNNPKVMEGHKVFEIEDFLTIKNLENCIVIISINADKQKIAENLRSLHINYVNYND